MCGEIADGLGVDALFPRMVRFQSARRGDQLVEDGILPPWNTVLQFKSGEILPITICSVVIPTELDVTFTQIWLR